MAKTVAKKVVVVKIKVQAPGGQATPAPPIGPALGQHGVNIGQFVSQFNERTKELNGTIVPVVLTVYKDKSFTFEVKSPPAAVLLKQAAQIAKGSGVPNKEKVGKVTAEDVRRIAKTKFKDLNAHNLAQAEKIIAGTARSMGIEIVNESASAGDKAATAESSVSGETKTSE
jgi:large subunit ribosomal protein L11